MAAAPVDLVVFRAVRAIDPSQALDAVVDVVIEAGRITRVGADAASGLQAAPSARIIDGTGKWLLPGFVEVHAHLREPGGEHKETIETGLRAAAAGGYAHVCAMPNTRPVNDSPAVTDLMLRRARQAGGPSLHPVSAVSVGLQGIDLVDMDAQKNAGAIAFSDDGRCVESDALMRDALEGAERIGSVVVQHAEDHASTASAQMNEGATSRRLGLAGWPRAAEDRIVARDIGLVEVSGARYHLAHVSTRGAVRIVRDAKARRLRVTAEVTPHHLLLDDTLLESRSALYKVNPPLREPEDIGALRVALADGTIDCIATDHAPHAEAEKAQALEHAPPGMIGLETCLPLMLRLVREGVLSLGRMIDALTASPAQIIGIEPPRIRVGAIAELCLIDPDAAYVLEPTMLQSKGKNTPFIGCELRGRVELSLAHGVVTWDRTRTCGEALP